MTNTVGESHLISPIRGYEIYECADIHFIDEERIEEEEKFDGYYIIVTSEFKMPDHEILDAYRSLWKINEEPVSFVLQRIQAYFSILGEKGKLYHKIIKMKYKN